MAAQFLLIDAASIQRALQKRGFYNGTIDNDFGPKSLAAARAALQASRGVGRSTYLPVWTDARVEMAISQWTMNESGISAGVADGIAGARTQVAVEKWQDHATFIANPEPATRPEFDAARQIWPYQRDVAKFYGEVGKNQVSLKSPYPLYLDWDLDSRIMSFSCHEKIHDAALRVMRRVLAHYGLEAIHKLGLDQFGGCLNVRPMRNGKQMSMHSWGIAIDWDADRNPLRATSKTALMATPPYAKFLDLWEEEGFVSLGRARNYDWMHVQAARL